MIRNQSSSVVGAIPKLYLLCLQLDGCGGWVGARGMRLLQQTYFAQDWIGLGWIGLAGRMMRCVCGGCMGPVVLGE